MRHYCISLIDSTMTEPLQVYGDEILSLPDFIYCMTKEEAEEALAEYKRIAKEKGWTDVHFNIEEEPEVLEREGFIGEWVEYHAEAVAHIDKEGNMTWQTLTPQPENQ